MTADRLAVEKFAVGQPVPSMRGAQSRFVAAVCGAHMMSHYYMLLLAPLFAFVRADFKVSYLDLALALTVFNVVSGLLMTPIGYVVDRVGARIMLIAGLALSSLAYAIAGIVDSYWVFIAMYGLAGVGNTVFHPSDYSLLSQHTPKERIGQVFALHSFAGILGWAIAPATLIFMQGFFGWRGAYVGAAILGFIVLAALIAQPEPGADRPHSLSAPARQPANAAEAWRMLITLPLLLNLSYFTLTSIMTSGLNNYLVVALGALHATPVAIANLALTSLLAMNAIGILGGGVLAARTAHHARIAASGLAVGGVATALVGLFDFHSIALILLIGLGGFCVGATFPSRDMLVRAVTPPGAYGLVFGFVSVGLSLGSSVAPIIYGAMMDNGMPRAVFLFSAAVSLLCISTVTFGFSRRQTA